MKAARWMLGVLLLFALIVASHAYAEKTKDIVSVSGKAHRKAGVTCADCHQMADPKVKAPAAACLKCHSDGSGKFTGSGAKKYAFDGGTTAVVNPHKSHLVELPCTECHKTHAASIIYCNKCHLFSDMPTK